MTRSLNEIEAMSKRAARGAGMSWGMAEEAGRAARYLSSYALDGGGFLASLLVQNDGKPHAQIAPGSLDEVWTAPSGVLCPLIVGACLNDCADRLREGQTIEMANVSHPILVLPFAIAAARYVQAQISLSWQDVNLTTDGLLLWIADPRSKVGEIKPVHITCSLGKLATDEPLSPGLRGDMSLSAWSQLEKFAHRTYAPSTAESRLLGAGAGTSDND